MANYANYVEEGLLKNIDNPFNEMVERSILGSDTFVEKIKRKYLLSRLANYEETANISAFSKFVFNPRNHPIPNKII